MVVTLILLKHCGETYHADIGDSIQCHVCGRTITVTRDPSNATVSRQPAATVASPQPKSPRIPSLNLRTLRIRNWLLPIFGFVALVAGVTLTILNYRARTNSNVVAQTSAAQTPSAPINQNAPVATHPSPMVAPKTASPTPQTENTAIATATSTNTYQNPYAPVLSPNQTIADDPRRAPTPEPETIRYPTGTNLIRPSSTSGRGVLHISNWTGFDAIAKLVDTRTNLTVRLVYIQANSEGEIASISSGDYTVKFALGTGYNPDSGRFLHGQSFAKFDETFDFHQYRTSDGIEWNNYNISLHPVVGGTATTSQISASEFYDH